MILTQILMITHSYLFLLEREVIWQNKAPEAAITSPSQKVNDKSDDQDPLDKKKEITERKIVIGEAKVNFAIVALNAILGRNESKVFKISDDLLCSITKNGDVITAEITGVKNDKKNQIIVINESTSEVKRMKLVNPAKTPGDKGNIMFEIMEWFDKQKKAK